MGTETSDPFFNNFLYTTPQQQAWRKSTIFTRLGNRVVRMYPVKPITLMNET